LKWPSGLQLQFVYDRSETLTLCRPLWRQTYLIRNLASGQHYSFSAEAKVLVERMATYPPILGR
jgi:hypothetical protein